MENTSKSKINRALNKTFKTIYKIHLMESTNMTRTLKEDPITLIEMHLIRRDSQIMALDHRIIPTEAISLLVIEMMNCQLLNMTQTD